MGDGKTAEDIGLLMGLTTTTVERMIEALARRIVFDDGDNPCWET